MLLHVVGLVCPYVWLCSSYPLIVEYIDQHADYMVYSYISLALAPVPFSSLLLQSMEFEERGREFLFRTLEHLRWKALAGGEQEHVANCCSTQYWDLKENAHHKATNECEQMFCWCGRRRLDAGIAIHWAAAHQLQWSDDERVKSVSHIHVSFSVCTESAHKLHSGRLSDAVGRFADIQA